MYHKKLYFMLQVMWESVSGTTSHVRCVWPCNEIEGSYDKIIIAIVPSYNHLFVAIDVVTRNNTDGNKLMILSSIALYYGDTYIVSSYQA